MQATEIQRLQSWQECMFFFLHNKMRFHTHSRTMISLDDAVQCLRAVVGRGDKGIFRME